MYVRQAAKAATGEDLKIGHPSWNWRLEHQHFLSEMEGYVGLVFLQVVVSFPPFDLLTNTHTHTWDTHGTPKTHFVRALALLQKQTDFVGTP